jgi:hypothetical protein
MNSQDNLVHELSELLSIEAGIRENLIGVTSPKAYAMAGIEDKLRQWLKKVQEIAAQYDVKAYTITLALSWPPGIQASFTWSTEDKDRGIGGFR